MNIWDILEIFETTDVKEIKRAYARLTKEIHPEEQPKEFQRLHDAYLGALSYAKMFHNNHVEVQYTNDCSQGPTKDTTDSFINSNSKDSSSGDQVAYTKESINLFSDFNSEELFEHRKQAVEKLKEIFSDYRWYDPKIWRMYASSECFQRVKDDREFLDYLYYVLQVMQIRIPYAKELYHGLGYDQDTYDILLDGDSKLYFLLKIYIEGPAYKARLSKIISVGCLLLTMLLMFVLPMLIPIVAFGHVSAYWYLIIAPKKDLDKFGIANLQQYEYYIGDVAFPFWALLVFQSIVWAARMESIVAVIILIVLIALFFIYSTIRFIARYLKKNR